MPILIRREDKREIIEGVVGRETATENRSLVSHSTPPQGRRREGPTLLQTCRWMEMRRRRRDRCTWQMNIDVCLQNDREWQWATRMNERCHKRGELDDVQVWAMRWHIGTRRHPRRACARSYAVAPRHQRQLKDVKNQTYQNRQSVCVMSVEPNLND